MWGQAEDQNKQVPIPDPTALTLTLVEKESQVLRDLFRAEIATAVGTSSARMDAQDNARASLRRDIEAAFTHADTQVANMMRLYDIRFSEKEQRLSDMGTANKDAIEAAFAAAKEAVLQQNHTTNLMMLKNEGMFSKQIDSLGSEIRTTTGALSDKIEEVKKQMSAQSQQVVMMQGKGTGVESEWSKHQSSTGLIVSIVVGGISFLAFLVVLFNVLMNGKL